MGNVAVAVSWSGYFCELLKGLRDQRSRLAPDGPARRRCGRPGFMDAAPHIAGIPIVFNLPAVLIVALVTWVLVIGVKESARFNDVMVVRSSS